MENYVEGFFVLTGVFLILIGFIAFAFWTIIKVYEELEWKFNDFIAISAVILMLSAYFSIFILVLTALGVE